MRNSSAVILAMLVVFELLLTNTLPSLAVGVPTVNCSGPPPLPCGPLIWTDCERIAPLLMQVQGCSHVVVLLTRVVLRDSITIQASSLIMNVSIDISNSTLTFPMLVDFNGGSSKELRGLTARFDNCLLLRGALAMLVLTPQLSPIDLLTNISIAITNTVQRYSDAEARANGWDVNYWTSRFVSIVCVDNVMQLKGTLTIEFYHVTSIVAQVPPSINHGLGDYGGALIKVNHSEAATVSIRFSHCSFTSQMIVDVGVDTDLIFFAVIHLRMTTVGAVSMVLLDSTVTGRAQSGSDCLQSTRANGWDVDRGQPGDPHKRGERFFSR